MTWIILSLAAACLESARDAFGKIALKNINEYAVSWSIWFFGLILLLPLSYFQPTPEIGPRFWLALVFAVPLEILSSLFFFKAIKNSDLSSVSPIVSFTPLFLLATSFLILNESPDLIGILGILLIVVGSYFLNLQEKHNGVCAPLLCLWNNKGSRYMLIVAFIWSLTAALGKQGVQNSSPLYWATLNFTLVSAFYFPLVLYKTRRQLHEIKESLPACTVIGLLFALTLICQLTAYSYALVSYVIALKRSSSVIDIFIGYFVFHEQNVKNRLIGGIIMIIGVLIITLLS